jgi:hypothetical protein
MNAESASSKPWADTTTPAGRLMLTVLGGLAEFERELIKAMKGGPEPQEVSRSTVDRAKRSRRVTIKTLPWSRRAGPPAELLRPARLSQ